MTLTIYLIIGGIALAFIAYMLFLKNMMKNRNQQQLASFDQNNSTEPLTEAKKRLLAFGAVLFSARNEKILGIKLEKNLSTYSSLETVCNHITVKHAENNYKTEGDKHTNNIEGFWSLFKRGLIGTYHYMSPKYLQRYMDETSYHYNTRKVADSNRFEMAILKCDIPRITYSKR